MLILSKFNILGLREIPVACMHSFVVTKAKKHVSQLRTIFLLTVSVTFHLPLTTDVVKLDRSQSNIILMLYLTLLKCYI